MAGFLHSAKASLVGMFVGLFLVPASIALHCWNEYRTIHRTQGIAEAQADARTIADSQVIASELEQSLVHLTGRADTDAVLEDATFGIREPAIRLKRDVEMYQWEEKTERRGNNDRKEYRYERTWSDKRIDSDDFHDHRRHTNPAMRFSSQQVAAEEVTLDAYRLSDGLITQMNDWQPVALDEAAVLAALADDQSGTFVVDNDQVHWGADGVDLQQPRVGDLRIVFKRVPPSDVSVLAKLTGNTFASYTTANGEGFERLYTGRLSLEQVIGRLQMENTALAWGLRFFGLVLCGAGFSMILGPLRALTSWVPFLGDLSGLVLTFIGGLMALVVSLTTISIAWIAVRPVLAIGLLIVAGLAAWMIYRLRSKRTEQPPMISESMVVDP